MRQLKITKQITVRTPSIERYFSEIEKEKMITQEEEIELAKRIREGDVMAEEKLVKANLRFVVSVAKKYARSSAPLEDLINEGNLGLIKAAKKFDETRGFKFISYAVWWVRQSILESMPTHMRTIRIPGNVQNLLEKIKRWSSEFEQKNGREPSPLEICEEFDIRETSDFLKMNAHSTGSFSLDNKLEEDGESTFADYIESGTIDAYDNIEKDNNLHKIYSLLNSSLSHMESEIICMTYGIGMSSRPDGMSNDEIGQHFLLTGERIRQIRERALKKMRSVAKSRRMY